VAMVVLLRLLVLTYQIVAVFNLPISEKASLLARPSDPSLSLGIRSFALLRMK